MTDKRSHRAAEASRRNGARSQGPRSEEGKASSARNAFTHGLFAAGPDVPSASAPGAARLAAMFASHDPALTWTGLDVDISIEAAVRLEQASRLVQSISAQVDEAIEHETGNEDLTALLEQLVRYRRYQRRYRGRRDKALRSFASRARKAARARLTGDNLVHSRQ